MTCLHGWFCGFAPSVLLVLGCFPLFDGHIFLCMLRSCMRRGRKGWVHDSGALHPAMLAPAGQNCDEASLGLSLKPSLFLFSRGGPKITA